MINLLRGAMAVIGAATLLTMSAAAAFAGEGYAGAGGVEGASAGGGGALPFTGSDIMLYGLIAAGLVASGLVLRSYSARRVD